jgi:hypothetical protein
MFDNFVLFSAKKIMVDQINTLISAVKEGSITFNDVIAFIESRYTHQPTAFKNGEAYNESDQNQGSAKVFAFAKIHHLTVADTLLLFAEHYKAVLSHPNATDHQNIRQFMANGWSGIAFDGAALAIK